MNRRRPFTEPSMSFWDKEAIEKDQLLIQINCLRSERCDVDGVRGEAINSDTFQFWCYVECGIQTATVHNRALLVRWVLICSLTCMPLT